jgi:hypothetical protein
MKATETLHEEGQSLWLDNITRDLLQSGTLERYIHELSVTGLTSNPTIFDHAIKNSSAYDAAIREKVREGKSGEDLFFESWRSRICPGLRTCFDRSGIGRAASMAGCHWRYRLCWPTTRPARWSPPRPCTPGRSDGTS